MAKLNYIILTAAVAVSLFSSSCVDTIRFGDEFLDKAKGEDVNEDLIFSKKVYTEYLLWQCYEGMYVPFKQCYTLNSGVMEALSDLMHSELGWDELGRIHYPATQTAANANPGWVQSRFAFITQGGIQNMSNTEKRSIWNCVRDCELLIGNIDRVPDMTDAEKARFVAEAKIILASKYLDGIRHFGGLPVVDHAFKGEDQMEKGRSSLAETVEFAVGLLDEAIAEPNLPWNLPESDIATWAGRMTKASAVGIKAKLLHYVASPLFNSDAPYCTEAPDAAVEQLQVWFGNYDAARWQSVANACEEFFTMNAQNGNHYQLIQASQPAEENYRLAYRNAYRSRGNRETLVEVHDRVYFKEWDQAPANVWHSGALAATLDWMEMFPWSDGKNFDGQKYYNRKPAEKDIFVGRDPRLYETMLVQKADYKWQIYGSGNPVQLWEGGEFKVTGNDWPGAKSHGFVTYKWVLDVGSDDQGGQGIIDDDPVQYAYVRLAEIYLIYAEALAELGRNADALKQINIVRSRVGLADIERANPELQLTSNKDNLIKEILRERACELGFEMETRFHDMNRRKLKDDFLKRLRGMRVYRIDDAGNRVERKWEPETEAFPARFEYVPYEIIEKSGNPRAVWTYPENWSPKLYLAPLPPDEINKNYGLTQNPGWI
jgi:hypothetical protein